MGRATDHKDSDANVKVILYKSKTLADGSHPLMLRITKDRRRKYISIGQNCEVKYWDEEKQEPRRNHPKRAEINELIRVWESKYATAATDLKQAEKPFTSETVAAQVTKVVRKAKFFEFADELQDRLTREGRTGTAVTVKDIRRALHRYEQQENRTPENLLFTDLSPAYLEDFRTHLTERGLAQTSMAVYFRTLRLIYNRAIKRGMVAQKHYPFNDFKLSQFDTRTRKRAIGKADIQALAEVEAVTPRLLLAKNIFLFSYYGAGINFIDLALLTWKDVHGGRLVYERQKTGHLFNIKLSEAARAILEHYRPTTASGDEAYVFPVLDKQRHKTPTQIDNRVNKVIGQVNKDLKVLAEKAGITVSLTTYVARHSFATALKYSGVATAIISQSMGHQTEAITQTYLASFENELIDNALDNL